MSRWRRPFHIIRQFFWALITKLSPARRVLLFLSLVLLLMSGPKIHAVQYFNFDFNFEWLAAALLLLLLSLELADKVTMKRDLEIAREIQSWLVPSHPPEVPGADIAFHTRPQNSVAGDYYDAFFPGSKRDKLLLVIADVAGKSVPAALLMATMQASLRTIAGEEVPLQELVCASESLRIRAQPRRPALYHRGDRANTTLATRHMNYVNAGHNPPILRRADGRWKNLKPADCRWGSNPTPRLIPARCNSQPGDALILYTDGVVEAFNAAARNSATIAGSLQSAICRK